MLLTFYKKISVIILLLAVLHVYTMEKPPEYDADLENAMHNPYKNPEVNVLPCPGDGEPLVFFPSKEEKKAIKAKKRADLMERVTRCLKGGQDVNAIDENGNFLLLEFAQSDHCLNITYALLDNGADPNQYNKRFETPLYEAASHLAAKTVNVLLKCGAHVDGPEQKKSPSDFSCTKTPLFSVYNSSTDWVIPKKVDRRIQIVKTLFCCRGRSKCAGFKQLDHAISCISQIPRLAISCWWYFF